MNSQAGTSGRELLQQSGQLGVQAFEFSVQVCSPLPLLCLSLLCCALRCVLIKTGFPSPPSKYLVQIRALTSAGSSDPSSQSEPFTLNVDVDGAAHLQNLPFPRANFGYCLFLHSTPVIFFLHLQLRWKLAERRITMASLLRHLPAAGSLLFPLLFPFSCADGAGLPSCSI
mgnify:CR=1 FL=1